MISLFFDTVTGPTIVVLAIITVLTVWNMRKSRLEKERADRDEQRP